MQDRNFDDLAERFQRKVYGGLKGQIRLAVLWRDLEQAVLSGCSKPLRVLDVGAGFSQLSIRLAGLGHQVVVNDLSEKMLSAARLSAEQEAGVVDRISWHQGPFQSLSVDELGQFDLVMSHALLEWLAEPKTLIPALKPFLLPEGQLSLTFYNYHSLVYRNLIRGNFNMLKRPEFVPDPDSLTPGNPLLPEQVRQWLADAGLEIVGSSGVRVFNDYVTTLRGGNAVPEAVIEMELDYSRQEPYLWLGRYVHHICRLAVDTRCA
ncbi:MAG: methyltransferase domain-containing protein [Chromatiales bacterium]|nr:methyltransferase domain-containing protein [Chromatiales bacterium]